MQPGKRLRAVSGQRACPRVVRRGCISCFEPWPRAQCQGPHRPLCCEHPPPQPLPHPGATLPRSLTVEALACRLSCCFFLPRSFKVGSGEGASGEDPQISGYVLAVLTPPLLLALHFLDWIMAPEPGLEEIWTLSVSSASFHQRGSRNHPRATEGAPPPPPLCAGRAGVLRRESLHDHPAGREGSVPIGQRKGYTEGPRTGPSPWSQKAALSCLHVGRHGSKPGAFDL